MCSWCFPWKSPAFKNSQSRIRAASGEPMVTALAELEHTSSHLLILNDDSIWMLVIWIQPLTKVPRREVFTALWWPHRVSCSRGAATDHVAAIGGLWDSSVLRNLIILTSWDFSGLVVVVYISEKIKIFVWSISFHIYFVWPLMSIKVFVMEIVGKTPAPTFSLDFCLNIVIPIKNSMG